jgi:hypothetical protein
MDTLPLALALAISGAALVVGASLSHWRWTRRLGLQGARASAHRDPVTHRWTIASREEAGGKTRLVFRCEECGALEVREMP